MASPKFFAAPFSQNGQLKSVGTRRVSDFSPDWLDLCGQMLEKHGETFHASFAPTHEHIEVHVNSAPGVGIAIFSAHGRIVVSTAYLRGEDTAAEQDVVRMFIASLRQAQKVRQTKATFMPFEDLASIKQRPLHAVVAWNDPAVSDEDRTVTGDLANHFAAAYLCRDKVTVPACG